MQYFLQGALFSCAIWFAILFQNMNEYVFNDTNFREKPLQVACILLTIATVSLVGLLLLVPAILMRYTMVTHLAQLQSKEQVQHAVEEAPHMACRLVP